MSEFVTFAFTPAGLGDPSLAIAASRAGGVGVYNGELEDDPTRAAHAIGQLAEHARGEFGVKIDEGTPVDWMQLEAAAASGLRWLFVDESMVPRAGAVAAWSALRSAGVRVVVEVRGPGWADRVLDAEADGLLLKGNEAGGLVGEDASFILLQRWRGRTTLPLYVRGGLTPVVAAACRAAGAAGGVLDSQLLLMDEVRLPEALRRSLRSLSGSETQAIGPGDGGQYLRVLVRPALVAARALAADGDMLTAQELGARARGAARWHAPESALLPIGQDVCFAGPWRDRYGHLGALLRAIDEAVSTLPPLAHAQHALGQASALARTLETQWPIVQGPMTRVSDTAAFADAVATAGALPMVAFAMLKGAALERLLRQTSERLGDRPWGIGLLGFAPQALLDEQLALAARFAPGYAIIAGGRPDQAVHLEQAGIATFLHVPSSGLIPGFLKEGARRFIFEGRECGGHIGPLSSFVLWSTMVERLLDELGAGKAVAAEVQILFAGGVHDAVSSAMVQVISAPLVAIGVKVGVLMGSAYLFTREIVEAGGIVSQFQREVLACSRTVNLESGPGHASRCADTAFAREFFEKRRSLKRDGVPGDESRRVLDDLILGRLRIASKGTKRDGLNGELRELDESEQTAQGMYMLGQVATLRQEVTSIDALHREVGEASRELLEAADVQTLGQEGNAAGPADIAIIGMATVVPQAGDLRQYWDNILAKVDAITEIPSHRWDWRLYFDEDRQAKDRIYSKWGGFLDDLPFDPLLYGMPPKAVESVDPMQMMGLEVARRTLEDAGYLTRPFDREKASVIIGASGGAGDYGLQYGLRSEIPRFEGRLPEDVAARLPQWTEDSFAGILPNVVAGRIANRLNFGGLNLAVDAACASSLAAVYQGVNELVAGRSDLVIAGGVDTVQGPFGYLCFSKTQALSPRGRCSTFDASGDGIVISEGIAMVALKRLADAERDGDRIYAVIKGVGASSDGNAKGLTAPLPAGQLRAMRRAYQMAGFGPNTVGLFEAHGTGTVAGDTAELESTTRLIREGGAAPRQAVIGSVKTNIGHTKATAGVAGLVKAAMALHRGVLPPHRNVSTPNRVLADEQAPLYLVDEAVPWLTDADAPRRAACSAFGFGGTNFHVVAEAYAGEYRDWMQPAPADAWSAELLVWRHAEAQGLRATLDAALAAVAALAPDAGLKMRDLAATLARDWDQRPDAHRDHRVAIVARNLDELRARLALAIKGLDDPSAPRPPGVVIAPPQADKPGKVAVLFSGQGSQYVGMLRETALALPAVAQTLGEADESLRAAFSERFGPSARLSHFIFPRGAYGEAAQAQAQAQLTRTDVAQPALGAVEVGLYRAMLGLGLRADMFAGHSYGEFVALHAAGVMGFDALMQVSAARGRFIVDAAAAEGAELGTMAAVAAERARVDEVIAEIDGVVVANHNGPKQTIVSGTRDALAKASERLSAAGVDVTPIPVAAAFHSRLVAPAQRALAELIDAADWGVPAVPVYANTTGRPHADRPERVKRQMAEHLVQPVEFVAQVQAMHDDGARVFVEVGPKAVLSRLASKILAGRPHAAIALDDGSGLGGFLGGLAALLGAGVPLRLTPLFERRACHLGKAEDLSSLLRTAQPARHAWLLNGSGARRVGQPVRQIGVTLEQRDQMTGPTQPAAAAGRATPAPAQPAPALEPAAVAPLRPMRSSFPTPSRSPLMDSRRAPAGMTDGSVVSEYFATMRQFLETQERVMAAFLGADAAAPRPVARLTRPAPVLQPRLEARAPMAAPSQAVPVQVAQPAQQAPAKPQPQAVAQPSAAAEPVAAAAVKPAAAKAESAPAAPAGAASAEKLLDTLLAIVEEKTGYPRDMVGLEQNLESELGIDSIKRIEIVGAVVQTLPEAQREALKDQRSALNTQPNLKGMLDLLTSVGAGGALSVPFEFAEAGARVDPVVVDHPPRYWMKPRAQALEAGMARRLGQGRVVLTDDLLGVSAVVARRLKARGLIVERLAVDGTTGEPSLVEQAAVIAAAGPVAGLLHLAGLGMPELGADAGADAWRAQLWRSEKSLFVLLKALWPALTDDAHVVAATGLGGLFGRGDQSSTGLRICGGAVGALKSVRDERPGLRVKAVDLDPSREAGALAADLIGEIELDGGRQEVGYPQGVRTVFESVAADAATNPERIEALSGPLVVLASGGARGITAEVLRELARPGAVLALTGRSPWPGDEAPEIAACSDADALRAYFVGEVRGGRSTMTPAQIQREVGSLIAMREMRANRSDLEAAGAAVEYHAVDVTDAQATQALVDDLVARHGRIDGVVHGAGIIEDRRLVDKDSASWSRVVETKVAGLLSLQAALPVAPRFFCVFSSVAGRYGNSGQADYATANELMNRLCESLQRRWGASTVVSAMCWGPWGATTHGAGMVTAQTEAKFAEKGVRLVDAALGRRLFREELARAGVGPVEVVFGSAPWESREAEHGVIQTRQADSGGATWPRLPGIGASTSEPTGERMVDLTLDPDVHVHLRDHVIDGKPVLPAAMALELMAQAVASLWPGWKVVEVKDHRLMKGVDLAAGAKALQVHVSPPPYGSSEGFEVNVVLRSELAPGRWLSHYRNTIRLAQVLPPAPEPGPAPAGERELGVAKAYGEWLFHGPCWQRIERFDALSSGGASARVRTSQPAELVRDTLPDSQWLFDPGLLDVAAQMAWLWARAFRDESALPARFGCVQRHAQAIQGRVGMLFRRRDAGDATVILADVVFVDEQGTVVLSIEGLESIASAALNRLGGTAPALLAGTTP